jgi:general secretion pathway protein H
MQRAVNKGRSNKRVTQSQQGFTLLEVMVVIIIIATIFSMTNLSVFQSADRRLEEEARRFAALVQLLNEESIIKNIDYAVGLSKREYAFFQPDSNGKLHPLDDSSGIFRQREIPDYGELTGTIAGGELDLPTSLAPKEKKRLSDEEDELPEQLPAIYILSSGEMTEFAISIKGDEGQEYTVEGDFTGKVRYLGRTDEN